MIEPEATILHLLDKRGAGKTICPSEAARLLAGPDGDWRAKMEEVHEALDHLVRSGDIALSWKGEELDQRRGPYRIARR